VNTEKRKRRTRRRKRRKRRMKIEKRHSSLQVLLDEF